MGKDLLLLLAGAVIALVGSYFVAYTSSPLAVRFRNWRNVQEQKRASKSIEKAKKRISYLEARIKRGLEYTHDPARLIAIAARDIAGALVGIVILSLLGFSYPLFHESINTVPLPPFIPNLWELLLVVTAIIAILVPFTLANLMEEFSRFSELEVKMRKEIEELQNVVDGKP